MADISFSAAKEHILKGAGEVKRVSKDAVGAAKDFGQQYLNRLGSAAAEFALQDQRKTIMPQDIRAAFSAQQASPAPPFSSEPIVSQEESSSMAGDGE